jgi:hypothetical protein
MTEPADAWGGAADFADFMGKTNGHAFLIQQALAQIENATLVKIVGVTNAGGVTAVGFVDVQPLVNQVSGQAGDAVPHGVVHNLPYFRLQGGANAVILDPVIGDIGIAVIAGRDISRVKSTRKQANPGSRRRFDWADGLYIGGVLNGAPTQFIAFSSTGIAITSPTAITMTAPHITITGALTNNGKDIGSGHEHSGVQAGSSNTGPPI